MVFTNHIPSFPLRKYVAALFHIRNDQTRPSMERLIADGSINVIIELDDLPRYIYDNEDSKPIKECRKAWITGMHKDHLHISSPAQSELFVIRFKPGGSHPFFKIPVRQMNERVVNASTLIGNKILDFRKSLLAIEEPEKKLEHGEKWLTEHFDMNYTPEDTLWEAITNITTDPSFDWINLQQLIASSGYSEKEFRELFKKHVGPAPRTFYRISRFNEALSRLQQDRHVNWVKIGTDCGYNDPEHLLKDFNQFSGLKPDDYPNREQLLKAS